MDRKHTGAKVEAARGLAMVRGYASDFNALAQQLEQPTKIVLHAIMINKTVHSLSLTITDVRPPHGGVIECALASSDEEVDTPCLLI